MRRWPLLVAALLLLCSRSVHAPQFAEIISVEPYAIKQEYAFLQGELLLQPDGQRAPHITFTGSTRTPTPNDWIATLLSSDTDFILLPLDDCWNSTGFSEAFITKCCSEGSSSSTKLSKLCFDPVWTYNRCCIQAPLGREHLEKDMEVARRAASPFLPRFRLDEESFRLRRLRHRVGRHEENCSSVNPNYTLPNNITTSLQDRTLESAFQVLKSAGVATHQALHIGINDGKSGDPLYPLIMTEGMRGLGLEAEWYLVNKSRENLPGRFRVEQAFATPLNIWQYAGPLGALDMVVTDIDSWDCAVIQSILQHSRGRQARTGVPMPALIYFEINTMIPPPFKFSRGYDLEGRIKDRQGHQVATASCSLSFAVARFGKLGYELATFGYDALFVRRDLVPLFASAWGHRFPKDEFMCYRRGLAYSINMAPDSIRNWFFRTDDPQDLEATTQDMLQKIDVLSNMDGFSGYPFTFGL